MTTVARVTRHPHDTEVVLVDVPSALNRELARFEAARFARDHRAYVVHVDHLDAFTRFARGIGLYIIDERNTRATVANPAAECRWCQQPGSKGKPPSVCPSCGRQWEPVPPPPGAAARATRTACPSCGRRQTGRFPYCSECGAEMVYPAPQQRPSLKPVVDANRPKLKAPMLLADVMDHARPSLPATHGPEMRPWHKGRHVENVALPVENVALPDDPEPTPPPEDDVVVEDPPEEPSW